MNNLTEQWKDGTLKAGAYYILSATGGIFPDSYNPYGYFEQFDSLVKEVLAPVPSYEEFDNVIKCYLCAHEKADRFEKENQKLKEELKDYEYQHKQDGICYDDIFCKLELARKENAQLKELLKECKEPLEVSAEKRDACDWYPEDVLAKLYQALGEDK